MSVAWRAVLGVALLVAGVAVGRVWQARADAADQVDQLAHLARCAYAAGVVDGALHTGGAEDDIPDLLSGEDCRSVQPLLTLRP